MNIEEYIQEADTAVAALERLNGGVREDRPPGSLVIAVSDCLAQVRSLRDAMLGALHDMDRTG